MSARNPYAPPVAPVADPIEQVSPDASGILISNGRRVSPGMGGRWIGEAWLLFSARPGKWLLTFLLSIFIYVVASWIPLAEVVHSLLSPFIGAGIVTAADRQQRTGTFNLDALLAGFRKPGPLLAIGAIVLLSLVVLYVSCAIVIGTDFANRFVLKTSAPVQRHWRDFGLAMVLYAVLALPITAATWLAPPLVMLHGLSGGSAMKMSLIGSFKNLVPGIVYGVCATLFVFLSIIPLGLGLLVSIPVMMISSYTVYRSVFVESR